jgi:uncharacterized protein DUF4410
MAIAPEEHSMVVRIGLRFALFAVVVALAACANSVSQPVAVQELSPSLKLTAKVIDVTGEAQNGVVMDPREVERVVARVKTELAGLSSQGIVVAGSPDQLPTTKIKIIFTQYDKGSAVARFLLAGLGQIHIDADVIFIDGGTGTQLAKYQVQKQFAFGGIYGGATSVEDVEVGFAKSVAEILKTKT